MRSSQHATIVIVKWLLTGAALAVALPAGGLGLRGGSLTLSLLVAVASYAVGDLLLLPRLGVTTTAIVDGIGAALLVNWFVAAQTGLRLRAPGFLAIVLTVGAVEWLLHPTLLRLMRTGPGRARASTITVPAPGRDVRLTRVGNSPLPVDPINDPRLPLRPGDNNQIQLDGEQPARTGAASATELPPPDTAGD